MVRITKFNLPEETNKFRRDKSFSEIVTDYWIEEAESWDGTNDKPMYNLIFETETEPNLQIKLAYDRWEEHMGEKQPKAGSTVYKFFSSFVNLDVEIDINVETKSIQFYPEIRGKRVAFEVEHKSFTSKTEMDEEGKPKVIPFDVWTVAAIGNGQATIPTETSKPAPTPKAEPETPIDEEEIKAGYLKILSGFGYEKFTLPNIIGIVNKYFTTNPETPNRTEYTNASKRMKYLSALVNDGYMTKGEDGNYQFVEGMIEAIEG